MTRFTIHGNLTASGAELAAKKVGLENPRLMGRLAGREAANKENNIIGDMAYSMRKRRVRQGEEVACLYIKGPNLN